MQRSHEGLDCVQNPALARAAVEDDASNKQLVVVGRFWGVDERADLVVDHAAPIAEYMEDEGVVGDVVLCQDIQKPLSRLPNFVRLEEQRLGLHAHFNSDEPAHR